MLQRLLSRVLPTNILIQRGGFSSRAPLGKQNAIIVDECGGPEVLRYGLKDIPVVKEREVLIKNEAIGVNYIDVYFRTGLYQTPKPISLGRDGAGVVEAVGQKVTLFKPGDRVAYCMVNGTYSEYVSMDESMAVKIPDELNFGVATASMVQGLTAHYLADIGLKPGSTVLVHAAAGGVGYLLTQVAKIRGAKVIATVSTPEKAKLARGAGADHVIDYSKHEFSGKVKELTDGKGVDVVYDGVGVTTFEQSLVSLVPRGYMVIYGAASGPVPKIDVQILNQYGSLFLTRPNLINYINNRNEYEHRCNELFGWIKSGKLKTLIGGEFLLKDARHAHILLEARKTTGKILLIP